MNELINGCSGFSLLCVDMSCGDFSGSKWRYEDSFRTRDSTCVPCTGRQILKHWTTREVLS